MRVIIEPDYQALSQWAANYVASKINAANPTPEKPFVLGCPTGSSPLGMYKALIELNKQGKVSFQNVVTFNMDEYVGLPEDHPESYHTFMWKNFFNHIDIKKEKCTYPERKCRRPGSRMRQLRKANSRNRRHRPVYGRYRSRRTYRIQRTGFIFVFTHTYQNTDYRHNHCKLTFL